MRLEKIKLAGFKSFVEPTTIPVAENLVGIVGPNGCGKSNIIDAVRWVMGEISAKHLRGKTMADVIFNGSSSRKPVAMAFVELIFENRDNRIGGEFANYDTISLKRQVTRDGQSIFFLNGSRCRRKDITDIFLGTGVGSRSYAIIEQGTISRLVEAKPEELRGILEEAAGISKYKERRRETGLRMDHTRENLERVNDIRNEVSKQHNSLKRQAKKAEKYKFLKHEQRRVKQQLLAMRWRIQEQKVQADTQHIQTLNDTLKNLLVAQQHTDKSQVQRRDTVKNQQRVLNEIQGEFYSVSSEISRLEQMINLVQASRDQLNEELDRLTGDNRQVSRNVEHDRLQLDKTQTDLETTQQQLKQTRNLEKEALKQQTELVREQEERRVHWDQNKDKLAVCKETSEVQHTKIKHLEKQGDYLEQRSKSLVAERNNLLAQDPGTEIPNLEENLSRLDCAKQDIQSQLESSGQEIDQIRQSLRNANHHLNQIRAKLQDSIGRISSLELLQKHALGKHHKSTQRWLKNMGLKDAARLAQFLEVDPVWENAVEIVLNTHLEAICLADISQVSAGLNQLEDETVVIFETSDQPPGSQPVNPADLLHKVKSPWDLVTLLSGVFCADTLHDAKLLAKNLNPHESVITPDGIQLGPNWIVIAKSTDEKSGVLKREKELRTQRKNSESLQHEIDRIESQVYQLEEQQHGAETHVQTTQHKLNQLNSQLSDYKSQLSATLARNEEAQKRIKQIANEQEEIHRQQSLIQKDISGAYLSLDGIEKELVALDLEKNTLSKQIEKAQERLQKTNATLQNNQDDVHDLKSRTEALGSSRTLILEHLTRAENQLLESNARLHDVQTRMEQSVPSLEVENEQLEQHKKKRREIEKTMQQAREELAANEIKVTELDEARIRVEREIETQRGTIEKARVDMQTALVLRQTIEEQLQEMAVEANTVLNELPADAAKAAWEENYQQLTSQIERLGAINLTAVEEYTMLEERMDFLTRQYEDIAESLEILEQAIRKIDRESSARFKETFSQINDGLQQNFPKLFGGGKARLEISDENLLEAGVTLVACPPGKRNTSIHLLSGGEKALTAVALVFSIFQLNPAPFCLLDEVDAPLDDTNVGRYSQLLMEMSKKIQFLFISHNKVTMEIAEHLIGITMNEPGVSRLVTVDIDEAVKMAV